MKMTQKNMTAPKKNERNIVLDIGNSWIRRSAREMVNPFML
jgi:hypothetical protein